MECIRPSSKVEILSKLTIKTFLPETIKLIPRDHFLLDSPYSAAEITQRLQQHTTRKSTFWLNSDCEFKGRVGEYDFELIRNSAYQNSFLPVINGKINPVANGCHIAVTMRLHLLVSVFMMIWFSFTGVACIISLSNLHRFSLPMLIPFAMIILGIVMVSGGFWYEACKQKKRLTEILTQAS